MMHQLRSGFHKLSKLAVAVIEKHCPMTHNNMLLLHHQAVNISNFSRVLTTSSLMKQDGLYINELPIVMCRADPSMFPFLEPMRRTETMESRQDIKFKSQIHKCSTVQDVFQLLEIPKDTVSGYAATYALQRLSQLPNPQDRTNQSFIRTAILNELCETVLKDISGLSNDAVISLIHCCSRLNNINKVYVDKIIDVVEKRVGRSAFSIDELCTLVEIISNDPHANQSVANNIWIHIGDRKNDIVAGNIAHVYSCVKYFSSDYKYMLNLLSRQLSLHWWKLTNSDVVTILSSLTKFSKDVSDLKHFGRWVFMNVHAVTDTEMKAIVAAFTHFTYNDEYLRTSLERYLSTKINHMDLTLISMIQHYLCSQRHLSIVIMDTVAKHFTEKGNSFEPYQIFFTLKSFGELNYLPTAVNSYQLFKTVEDVLYDKFSAFNVDHLLQLLCSFVYVERFPINFVRRIFTPHFISKINGLEEEGKERATRNLQQLYTALILETSGYSYRIPYRGHKYTHSKPSIEGRHSQFHNSVKRYLEAYIGSDYFEDLLYASNTPHLLDFCVHLKEGKAVIMVDTQDTTPHTKLAILLQMPEHYCVNTNHLMGEYAMKNRHLRLMGYEVLELEYNRTETNFLRQKYIMDEIKTAIEPSESHMESTLIENEDT